MIANRGVGIFTQLIRSTFSSAIALVLFAACGERISITGATSENALPTDVSAPDIAAFFISPSNQDASTVTGITLSATDNVGVLGYYLSETTIRPQTNAPGWAPSAPSRFSFTGIPQAIPTVKTLYAWAKDAAGNVSSSKTAAVTITVADSTAPTVTAFTIPATATSQTISISSFTATDNVAVTGYLLTETPASPSASAAGWASSAPVTYAFAGIPRSAPTLRTLYAWARDAVGNVSNSLGGSTTITLPPAKGIATAILDYTNATPAQLAWINRNFTFKIGGSSPNNNSMSWIFYRDMKGLATTFDYIAMKDFAAQRGYDYRKMLLHATVDFTSVVSQAWYQMDKFDNFEGTKGVMRTADDITFSDLTSTAYGGSVTWQNIMYVGYEEPFDQINLVFSTVGSGITCIWEYWNGTKWATLATSGAAAGLTANGQVYFLPPSDWSVKSVNGSRSKYFVRCRIISATVKPVTTSVRGDNWLRGAPNLCRGWSFTDANRINIGTPLEYNPNPPVGSSAKFPHQSHISFWSNNHFKYNPAYKVNGNRAVIDYIANTVNSERMARGYTGVMMDEAGIPGAIEDGVAYANTDFYAFTSDSLAQVTDARFSELQNVLHSFCATFLVGLNAKEHSFITQGTVRPDYNLDEYNTFSWYTYSPGQFVYGDYSSTDMAYDDYLPVNNPTSSKGILLYRDDSNNGVIWGHPDIPWDMANRGPVSALSKHLISYNDNLVFSYHTNPSSYVYSETDQAILKDGSVIHMSVDPIPKISNVKRWATWFPAMAVDFGVPTGARNKSWALGANIGGGQNVWRRDWSNAIVLHRPSGPGYYDSQHYSTYSSPIALGGVYYLLYADGTTSDGITSIALRHNEGAILMKYPLSAFAR